MSETTINNVKRKVIKIGVILQYGESNARIISDLLKCENTEEKLQAIKRVDELTITPEQKLFVAQKLLAYPKAVRHSIADQLIKKLDNKEL